jgi:signal peptidase II
MNDAQRLPAARRQWLVFGALAAAIIVIDQIVKAWIVGDHLDPTGRAVANFQLNTPTQVLGDTVRIWFIHNSGALFGLFRDQAAVFAALSVGVVALIIWYHGHAMHTNGWLATVALGLLLGGAVGNLIDRIRIGYVIDFVDMGIGNWRFYTYNVADSAISTSLLLLIVMALWPRGRIEVPATPGTSAG